MHLLCFTLPSTDLWDVLGWPFGLKPLLLWPLCSINLNPFAMATKIGINGFGRIGRSFDNRMTDGCLFGGFFVCLLACLFVCLLACLFVCLFACLSVCLLACLFVCLLVCLFACLFVCLFACLLVCLFVCLFAGWWFQIFFIFTPIWGRFPFWLIFFRWVETTNQVWFGLVGFPSFVPLARHGLPGHLRSEPPGYQVGRRGCRWYVPRTWTPSYPSKIEWDLTNGPLGKLPVLLETQGSVQWVLLEISWIIPVDTPLMVQKFLAFITLLRWWELTPVGPGENVRDEIRCRQLQGEYTIMSQYTLPETNISPENRPLEVRRFLLETIIFRGELLVSGSVRISLPNQYNRMSCTGLGHRSPVHTKNTLVNNRIYTAKDSTAAGFLETSKKLGDEKRCPWKEELLDLHAVKVWQTNFASKSPIEVIGGIRHFSSFKFWMGILSNALRLGTGHSPPRSCFASKCDGPRRHPVAIAYRQQINFCCLCLALNWAVKKGTWLFRV